MKKVRAKKHLGQHFLKDRGIASRIADLVDAGPSGIILEIGPGMGVLTRFLWKKEGKAVHVAEVDSESVAYLESHFPDLQGRIHHEDFLQMDLSRFGAPLDVMGNFPYNISSPILFHVLDQKEHVPYLAGMFQKEVAERVCSGPGSKAYGIISVLLQTYYDVTYHFDVPPEVFDPPPKVQSGVMSMQRNEREELGVPYSYFRTVVRTAFNQRRKTLHNSLKSLHKGEGLPEAFAKERPEQLSVEGFLTLAQVLYERESA